MITTIKILKDEQLDTVAGGLGRIFSFRPAFHTCTGSTGGTTGGTGGSTGGTGGTQAGGSTPTPVRGGGLNGGGVRQH